MLQIKQYEPSPKYQLLLYSIHTIRADLIAQCPHFCSHSEQPVDEDDEGGVEVHADLPLHLPQRPHPHLRAAAPTTAHTYKGGKARPLFFDDEATNWLVRPPNKTIGTSKFFI